MDKVTPDKVLVMDNPIMEVTHHNLVTEVMVNSDQDKVTQVNLVQDNSVQDNSVQDKLTLDKAAHLFKVVQMVTGVLPSDKQMVVEDQ